MNPKLSAAMTASPRPCYTSVDGGRAVLIYLNAPLQMRVHLMFDNAAGGDRHVYTARPATNGK